MRGARFYVLAGIAATIAVRGQDSTSSEKWNVYFQATSIGQYHPSFGSPYEGMFSLAGHPEAEVSLTSTMYFG